MFLNKRRSYGTAMALHNSERVMQQSSFDEKGLERYMKEMGAERVYVLGKDIIAVFRGSKGRSR